MEADRERGTYFDPKAGRADLAGVAGRWLASRMVDESTKIRYESLYRLHIQPALGGRQVKAIRPSDVQALQADLGRRFGGSTVAGVRLVLLGVLDLAVEDELIRKNPARSKVVSTATNTSTEKVRAWDRETVLALIDAHPRSLQLLPQIGATAGLREGELFGLSLEDIDFEQKVIRVRRQLKKLGGRYVFGLPKNNRPREVPLADWTAQSIKAHVDSFGVHVCSLPWERVDGKLATHNLLLRWADGGHMKARAYSETVWKPACVAAGVLPEPVKDARGRRRYATTRKEGTHQLRHHYASMMLRGGVNVKELAEYLGHADPGFTLRVYAHLLPDSHDIARRVIDESLFRPGAVPHGTEAEQAATR